MKNIISAVDFVDNELKRDGNNMCVFLYICPVNTLSIIIIILIGILGGGSFNQALKSHWLNPIDPDSLSTQNVCVVYFHLHIN